MRLRILILSLLLALLAACGQKGNLYLPGQTPPGRLLGHKHSTSQPAASAETLAAPAESSAAPAETTAAPAETSASPAPAATSAAP